MINVVFHLSSVMAMAAAIFSNEQLVQIVKKTDRHTFSSINKRTEEKTHPMQILVESQMILSQTRRNSRAVSLL